MAGAAAPAPSSFLLKAAMRDSPVDEHRSEVVDRADPPRGLLNTAWPVVALALLLVLLVRACVP